MESKKAVSYRSSKHQYSYKVDHDHEVEHCVALPLYDVLLIFDNGDCAIVNVLYDKEKYYGKLEQDIKEPFLYDKGIVGYISTKEKCIRFFNIYDKTITNIVPAELPTSLALPTAEVTDEKLENLYRDGTKLAFLKDSKMIVSLEMKFAINPNSNDNVVTVFHADSNPNFTQSQFNNTLHKQFFISPLNRTDTIAVWGQQVNDVPFEFFFWNVSKKNEGIISKFTLSHKLNATVIDIFPYGNGKFSIWGNYNQGCYPFVKSVDIESPQPAVEKTVDLDIFTEIKNEDDRAWMFTDIFVCDYDQQKVIWDRKGETGDFRDLYIPTENKCSYSERQPDYDDEDEEAMDNAPDLYRIASTDGTYVLGYNPDIEPEEGQKRRIEFQIDSVVKKGATLINMLEQSGGMNQYGEFIAQQVLNQLIKE